MQIITVTAAVIVGALSSTTYVQYAASRSPGRPILCSPPGSRFFPMGRRDVHDGLDRQLIHARFHAADLGGSGRLLRGHGAPLRGDAPPSQPPGQRPCAHSVSPPRTPSRRIHVQQARQFRRRRHRRFQRADAGHRNRVARAAGYHRHRGRGPATGDGPQPAPVQTARSQNPRPGREGNFVAVSARFDESIRQEGNPVVLSNAWKEYQDQLGFGRYQSHGAPRQVVSGDRTVVDIPLRMAKQPGDFRVVFDGKGHIEGLWFLKKGVPVP